MKIGDLFRELEEKADLDSIYLKLMEKCANNIELVAKLLLENEIHILKELKNHIDFSEANYYPLQLIINTHNPDLLGTIDGAISYFSHLGIDAFKISDFSKLEVIKGYSSQVGYDHLTLMCFGANSKGYLKSLQEKILKDGLHKPDTQIVNFLINIQKQCPNINPDILKNVTNPEKFILLVNDVNFVHFGQIINFFGFDRAIKLMGEPVDTGILFDTENMFIRLHNQIDFLSEEEYFDYFGEEGLRKKFPKKPKNIKKDIHDKLSSLLSELRQKPFPLKRKYTAHLDGLPFGDNGEYFYAPKMNFDLIEIGSAMGNICVGNGYYAESSEKGDSDIVILCEKSGKYKYCIQVKGTEILQIKKSYNRAPNSGDKEKIKKFLAEHME